jgi:hypothetical protein
MMPFAIVVWLAITSAVIGLAVYRKLVARDEDDYLHVGDADQARTLKQAALATRLDAVDKWGKTLTIVAVGLGAILAGVSIYQAWLESLRINP